MICSGIFRRNAIGNEFGAEQTWMICYRILESGKIPMTMSLWESNYLDDLLPDFFRKNPIDNALLPECSGKIPIDKFELEQSKT